MGIRVALKAVLFLPGTFLHEFAHYLSAVILGQATGFSVMPRIERERIVFGSVTSRTRFRVFSSIIAVSPLVWWGVLAAVANHFGALEFRSGMPRLHLDPFRTKLLNFSTSDLFSSWLLLQIAWAGILSETDFRNFLKGLLSASGVIAALLMALAIYGMRS